MAILAVTSACAHRIPSTPAELRSLHLRRTSPNARGDDFVFVEPLGADVRVQVVRVQPRDACPGLLIEAAEEVIPGTTVQAVAGVPVCSLTPRAVAAASRRARSHGGGGLHFLGSVEAALADCGGAERAFVREMPPIVDDQRLAATAPAVAALWQLLPRLSAGIVDPSALPDVFDDAPPEVQARRGALAATLLTDLSASRFGPYFREALHEYAGPTARQQAVVEVVDRDALPLVDFAAPRMPIQALRAHEFGEVRLKLDVDRLTGQVTRVTLAEGGPIVFLVEAAFHAAWQWRFAPGAVTSGTVEVTIRFGRRCA